MKTLVECLTLKSQAKAVSFIKPGTTNLIASLGFTISIKRDSPVIIISVVEEATQESHFSREEMSATITEKGSIECPPQIVKITVYGLQCTLSNTLLFSYNIRHVKI